MSFLLNFEQLNAYLFRCSGDHDENTIPVTLGNSFEYIPDPDSDALEDARLFARVV